MFLPQVLFYGLTALGTALLNARRRFAAPAFAPVLNNVVVIGVLVAFAHLAGRTPSVDQVVPTTVACCGCSVLGTTAGIVAMTVVLWPACAAPASAWRWRFEPRNPAVRKVAWLSGWTLGYVVANQVALVIVPGAAPPRAAT